MTVLLNGRFREYLETETCMNRLERRKARRTVRNLALKHSHVDEVDRETLNEFESKVLQLFIDYRLKYEEIEDRVNLHVPEGRSAA